MKNIVFIILIFCSTTLFSQETQYINRSDVFENLHDQKLYNVNDTLSYLYKKPVPFVYIKHSLQDLYQVPKVIFRKESIKPIIGVAASTALLIAFDEDITRKVKQFSRYIHLSPEAHDKNISPVEGVDFWIPTAFNTGLYYIGDGMTELAVNGSFYVYSLFTKDPRARQTASQLSEGMIATGIYVQFFKHLTGRTTAKYSGGKDIWRPFPGWNEYFEDVPKFDAFYSGHLTTAMMTTTVIAMNYPEKKYVRPLGYTLMALCGFQMINNGVHWAGDYPLAIAMGYTIAKVAVSRGRMQVVEDTNTKIKASAGVIKPDIRIKPATLGYGIPGLRLTATF